MTDPEPSRIKHEDTEEQIGWCPFLILNCWLLSLLWKYGLQMTEKCI